MVSLDMEEVDMLEDMEVDEEDMEDMEVGEEDMEVDGEDIW